MSIQQTATLNVGEKCLDFASWRDHAEMVRLGLKAAMRYVSTASNVWGQPAYSWKSLHPDEVKELHARGIGVIAMWEASGPDPLKGFRTGQAHGKQAVKSLTALGYPPGLPIFAAIDFDTTSANLGACTEYMRGFHGVLAADQRWSTGVYGDTDIIKSCAWAGTASYFHYAGATSWSHHEWLDIIHLRQSITASTPSYDNNYVFRPVPMWLPHEVADIPLPPSHQEFDMSNYVQLDVSERAYDSRDPKGPSKLQANTPRDIDIDPNGVYGGADAKIAIFHCEAVEAEGSSSLVFWNGNVAHPNVTSVGIFNGYGQSLVSAPVVNGHVTVQSGIATHLVIDVQAIITP